MLALVLHEETEIHTFSVGFIADIPYIKNKALKKPVASPVLLEIQLIFFSRFLLLI
jgi:hypothetical protein